MPGRVIRAGENQRFQDTANSWHRFLYLAGIAIDTIGHGRRVSSEAGFGSLLRRHAPLECRFTPYAFVWRAWTVLNIFRNH